VRDQDGKIIKKICYNYDGQLENCAIPACDYTDAIWENTSLPLRCEMTGCVSTGRQQEQVDNNACSATYGNKRWITVDNASCTGGGRPATITYYTTDPGYKVRYTNTLTGVYYDFDVPAPPYTGTLGCLPKGTYDVRIYKPGSLTSTYFTIGGSTISGAEATFYNVNITFGNWDIWIGLVP
jgi:hypothetical protein